MYKCGGAVTAFRPFSYVEASRPVGLLTPTVYITAKITNFIIASLNVSFGEVKHTQFGDRICKSERGSKDSKFDSASHVTELSCFHVCWRMLHSRHVIITVISR